MNLKVHCIAATGNRAELDNQGNIMNAHVIAYYTNKIADMKANPDRYTFAEIGAVMCDLMSI